MIENPATFTVEISRYQKYGEMNNSVESYPLWDIVVVIKEMAQVEQGCGDGDEVIEQWWHNIIRKRLHQL